MGHSCYSGPGRNSKARAGSNSCSHVLSFRIIDLGIDESYRSNLGIMTVGDGDAKTTRRHTQNPNSLCHRLARRACARDGIIDDADVPLQETGVAPVLDGGLRPRPVLPRGPLGRARSMGHLVSRATLPVALTGNMLTFSLS